MTGRQGTIALLADDEEVQPEDNTVVLNFWSDEDTPARERVFISFGDNEDLYVRFCWSIEVNGIPYA